MNLENENNSNNSKDPIINENISDSMNSNTVNNLKIVVSGLNKWDTKKQVLKLFSKWDVPANVFKQVKKAPKSSTGQILIAKEDLEKIQKSLVGKQVPRGGILGIRIISEEQDQDYQRKRKEKWQESSSQKPRLTEARDSVTPWHSILYHEQMAKKETTVRTAMEKLFKKMRKEKWTNGFPDWLERRGPLSGNFGLQQWDPIKEAPEPRVGYRNKVQFSCGLNLVGEKEVGFQLGSFKEGYNVVAPPVNCSSVSKNAELLAYKFRDHIKNSELEVWNKESYSGFYQMLTIKSVKADTELMSIVTVNPDAVKDPLRYESEKNAIKELFSSCSGVFIEESVRIENHTKEKMIKLSGNDYIVEEMVGMKFEISPSSFFQVNTRAAEQLYYEIGRWCSENEASKNEEILLDVCCGTGTIGLSLSSHFEKVIGLEIEESAIKDARRNAELNGISNAEFIVGKAEETIKQVLYDNPNKRFVAIVDPPRGGLHKTVVRALRSCTSLSRIIYVSCNVNTLVVNAIDLCKPTSKRVRKEGFIPIRGTCFDMFPDTPHVEGLVLFERKLPTL